MTTVNDIVDFVRIIRDQPEWNDTIRGIRLDRELLDLPQRFAEFVRVTEENNRLVAERLARMESDLADMKEWGNETTLRLDNIDGRLGNLEGAELERRVRSDIVTIASQSLGLNRVRIMQSRIVTRSSEFQDIIDDAEEQGRITRDQAYRLQLTDVIISARRRSDGQTVHVAIEVSRNIADHDIVRANERAQSLSVVQGTPAISVVVGANISLAHQEIADGLGVFAIILSRLAVWQPRCYGKHSGVIAPGQPS